MVCPYLRAPPALECGREAAALPCASLLAAGLCHGRPARARAWPGPVPMLLIGMAMAQAGVGEPSGLPREGGALPYPNQAGRSPIKHRERQQFAIPNPPRGDHYVLGVELETFGGNKIVMGLAIVLAL